LRTNKYIRVDENDDINKYQLNEENYDKHYNDKINKEKNNSN